MKWVLERPCVKGLPSCVWPVSGANRWVSTRSSYTKQEKNSGRTLYARASSSSRWDASSISMIEVFPGSYVRALPNGMHSTRNTDHETKGVNRFLRCGVDIEVLLASCTMRSFLL